MSLDKLTSREREVAKLAAEGLSNKEIGIKLGISWFTVKTHLQNISRKLKIHSKLELAVKMMKAIR